MTIPKVAEELNRQSVEFEIGNLHENRKRLHGLKRAPLEVGIFGKRSIRVNKEGQFYAFHLGGRHEMQFNIGEDLIENVEMIRFGVAFSLQLSRTLRSIDLLIPKIRRFNSYVNEHDEDFAGFSMWHYRKTKGQKGPRSKDRPVGSIGGELIKPGFFIMLGRRVPQDKVDVRSILAALNSLLPLYYFVEGAEQSSPHLTEPDFKPGCRNFIEKTTAGHEGQTIDVALRHRTLQMSLYKHLCQEAGCRNVRMERHLKIGVSVDGVVLRNGKQTFYEVKVASSVRSCVRAALGQLIEYCHWPLADRAIELIVVGEAELDSDSRAYLDLLRQRFGLPLWYRRIDIENDVLEGKA